MHRASFRRVRETRREFLVGGQQVAPPVARLRIASEPLIQKYRPISFTTYSRRNDTNRWTVFPAARTAEPLVEAATSLKRSLNHHPGFSRLREAYLDFRRAFLDAGVGARRILEPQRVQKWRWPSGGSEDPTVTPGVLHDVINALINNFPGRRYSPGIEDVRLASEILIDISSLYGMQSLPSLHSQVISRMSRLDPDEALRWIAKLGELRPAVYEVTSEDYAAVIRGLTARRDEVGMRGLLNDMRNHQRLRPNATVWHPYILFLATASPDNNHNFGRLEAALTEMIETDGVEPTVPLLSDIVWQYSRAQDYEGALKHVDRLRERIEPESPIITRSELCYAVAALTNHAGMRGGYDNAVKEALLLKDDGFPHNSTTMRTLMAAEGSPLFDAGSLVALANTLDVIIAPEIWAIAIRRAVQNENGLDRAIALHEESKLHRCIPTSGMVDPLIHALCKRSQPPKVEDVEQALEIYYDLRDAHKVPEHKSSGMLAKRHTPPDNAIFINLLQAISRSCQASQTTSDLIIHLLVDMRHFNVKLDPSFVQTVFAELLVVSDSHETAFKIWTYLREIDESVLNATGYATVLEQFAQLSFEDDPLPSVPHYLDIVQSMREGGVPITPFVYNIIFTRYAALARLTLEAAENKDPDSPEVQDGIALRLRMLEAVKKLHLTLKIDASFTPTVATMNAVMNAYNYLGAFREAYGVWDELAYGMPEFDHASVSIALDVCGYAGDAASADRVWRRARGVYTKARAGQQPFTPNANNWAALIECRTRLGKYESAVSAFREMLHAEDRNMIPFPDLKCAEVMVRCARSKGDEDRILSLLQKNALDLYCSLAPPLIPVKYQGNLPN